MAPRGMSCSARGGTFAEVSNMTTGVINCLAGGDERKGGFAQLGYGGEVPLLRCQS